MTIQDDTPQFVTHLSTFAFGKCLFHKYIGKSNACSASTSVGCSLRENILCCHVYKFVLFLFDRDIEILAQILILHVTATKVLAQHL